MDRIETFSEVEPSQGRFDAQAQRRRTMGAMPPNGASFGMPPEGNYPRQQPPAPEPAPEAASQEHGEGGIPVRMQKMLNAALPLLQKLLPLFDGNIGTAVGNLMAPAAREAAPAPLQPVAQPAPQQMPPQTVVLKAPEVDLRPIESGLAVLQEEQEELREKIGEQTGSIKRVEGQLELVRQATDRNTLEQQELVEDIKAIGRRMNLVAVVLLVMLGLSVGINVMLFLHLNRVLP